MKILGLFLNRLNFLRGKLLVQMVEIAKPIYGRFFQKSKIPWKQCKASLKKFPPKTLGNALGDFLEKENFELMPKFENHDVYHVLLNYKTTVVDEARMQFFLTGNGKYSLFLIGANLLSFIFLPEYSAEFIREFKKGKQAVSIAKWKFQHLLNEPLEVLQKIIFRQSNQDIPLVF